MSDDHDERRRRDEQQRSAPGTPTHSDAVAPGQVSRSSQLRRRANPEPSPFVAAMRRIASETSLQREAPPVADPTPSTPVQLRSAEPPPPPAADAPKAAESESLVPSDGDAKPALEKLAPHGVPALATGAASDDHVHEAAHRGVTGAGSALPHGDAIQRAFGRHDVSSVKAHVGGEAATASRAIGAEAYATGDHVAFAAAPSLHTAAHEAGHVVQQRGGVQLKGGVGEAGDAYEQHANAVADAVVQGKSAEALLDPYAGGSGGGAAHSAGVQRYEAGEHAKTGDTQDELKKAYAPVQYTVAKTDTLEGIADKLKMTPDELKTANPGKVKKVPAAPGSKKMVDGFAPGDQIGIPQKLNEMARDATKDPSIMITVNGVVLDYGTAIAMGGDLFGSPEEMAKASPEELKAIAALVVEEKQTGKLITTERWMAATHGRYLGLASKNEPHFAPSNPSFVAVSGQSTGDHKQSWESNHRQALDASRAGDKDKALLTNAFADHFLTDSFSAGHLFNKRDVMEKFNSQLPTTGKGDKRKFTEGSEKFFDGVAAAAFVGAVATEFSKYETAERMYGFHPNINSVSRFSSLLQGVHLEKPELLESAVAKGIHDNLNTHPGGIPVDNALGEKWPLSGDGTLNAQTLAIARRAVAQSQQNVIAVYRSPTEPDFAAAFKRVWDFTPRPTAEGRKDVTQAIDGGADINIAQLRAAIVDLIKGNYLTMLEELVKLNKLRKA